MSRRLHFALISPVAVAAFPLQIQRFKLALPSFAGETGEPNAVVRQNFDDAKRPLFAALPGINSARKINRIPGRAQTSAWTFFDDDFLIKLILLTTVTDYPQSKLILQAE